jgi:vacuolar-type H+-ATPase subunit F/Vma7
MIAPVYLGDEVTAAGYRLAGARVHVPRRGQEAAALAAACAEAPLVLVSAGVAVRIPESSLKSALAALVPLVLVVPDPVDETPVPDVAARLRRELGLEA